VPPRSIVAGNPAHVIRRLTGSSDDTPKDAAD
jgi:acetyltransferase-like isoleucine patch superfamily enzyme